MTWAIVGLTIGYLIGWWTARRDLLDGIGIGRSLEQGEDSNHHKPRLRLAMRSGEREVLPEPHVGGRWLRPPEEG